MKIGLFDSGLGGLTILRAVARDLPEYDYHYLADTAHLPYGDRSEADIYELTRARVEELFAADCVLVLIACNTASAETLRRLQDVWLPSAYPDRRLLGVIVPTIEILLQQGSRRVLVLATTRTATSGKYERELAKLAPGTLTLTTRATPELVPLIEANEMSAAITRAVAHIEAQRSMSEVDTVVLGCTHYTELAAPLRARFSGLSFVSQDEVIPSKLADYLKRHPELTTRLTRTGRREVRLTQTSDRYDHLIAQLLGGSFVRDGSP